MMKKVFFWGGSFLVLCILFLYGADLRDWSKEFIKVQKYKKYTSVPITAQTDAYQDCIAIEEERNTQSYLDSEPLAKRSISLSFTSDNEKEVINAFTMRGLDIERLRVYASTYPKEFPLKGNWKVATGDEIAWVCYFRTIEELNDVVGGSGLHWFGSSPGHPPLTRIQKLRYDLRSKIDPYVFE